MMKLVVQAPGEGQFVAVGSTGAGVVIKASDPDTGGLCTVWEARVEAGAVGAGAHYHRARDEFFYILYGEMTLRIGDEERAAPAGTSAFIPRGTVHGFRNASREPATILVVHHPAGFERFFDEMRELMAQGGSPEERLALAASFDMYPVQTPPRA